MKFKQTATRSDLLKDRNKNKNKKKIVGRMVLVDANKHTDFKKSAFGLLKGEV